MTLLNATTNSLPRQPALARSPSLETPIKNNSQVIDYALDNRRTKRATEMPKQHINQSMQDYEKGLDRWTPGGSQAAKKAPLSGWEVAKEVVIGFVTGGPGGAVRRPSGSSFRSIANIFKPKGGQAPKPVQTPQFEAPKVSNAPGVTSLAAEEVGGKFKLGGNMSNLKQVNGDLYSFQDMYKGQPRLNVAVHGRDLNPIQRFFNKPSSMVLNNKDHTAAELLSMLHTQGIDPKRFPNVRLLMCFSGNGGPNSFGSQFQKLTGVPTKAYEGTVTANFEPGGMKQLFDFAAAKNATPDLQQSFANGKTHTITKGQGENYRPVHFGLTTA